MDYAVGKAARIVTARLYEGEDLYECIEGIAAKEDIKCAAVFITGGIRKAKVVVGPKAEKPKIEPDFKEFVGPGETLGVGTLYWDDEGPKLHLHAATGKRDEMIIGCPRGGTSVFLILEITIIEIAGINASRKFDLASGVKLLAFEEKLVFVFNHGRHGITGKENYFRH